MKLYFTSLGCDKNLVDSERMLAVLTERGYTLTDQPEEADAAVVNTCCFIEDAKRESIEQIFELASLKEHGRLKVLVASGCMAERYKDQILDEIPELDAVIGPTAFDKIADAVDEAFEGKRPSYFKDISSDSSYASAPRILTTGGHFAYLKIAEGCNKNCSYCAIPLFRGRYRSYPMEDLLSEARKLAEGGVKELILIAEETTLYGTDLYGKKCLHELLEALCQIPELRWIRILYCYPEEIYPELIDTIAREEKICNYLDLPIQHASDRILKAMHRRTNQAELRGLIQELREKIPGIVLRTTLISGFPGETEEDHEELMGFVKEMRFDRLGAFLYSREEGTAAAAMKGQVPKKIKQRRYDELMSLQQGISLERNHARIGQVLDVFTEGSLPEEGTMCGRSYGDAPEVDGFVFYKPLTDHMSGSFARVRIEEASEYDLYGSEVE